MTSTLKLDTLDIVTHELFQQEGYQWEAWDLLRREAPVYWYEREDVEPFWVITKHEDILRISKDPETFISSDRLVITKKTDTYDEVPDSESAPMILNMDPPEHAVYRNVVTRRFSPRGLDVLMPQIEAMSTEILDDVVTGLVDDVAGEGHIDFVTDLAAKLPVYAICELLGVPRERASDVFEWTNESIGAGDPEYQKGRTRQETNQQARMKIYGYFHELLQERKQSPRNDLISMMLEGKVNGRLLNDGEILSYCFLLMVAGNETTRNATTGGMLALIQHPEQMEKLKKNPGLAHTAVEEILRWSSPIIQFARTCTRDTEIRGQTIRAGDAVGLYYPSANRDEDVFENPYTFDIERDPNDHLAFGGYGEHFCLGANLARAELRTVYREILTRITDIELDGPVERLNSSFVGGIKHLPVKFKVVQ